MRVRFLRTNVEAAVLTTCLLCSSVLLIRSQAPELQSNFQIGWLRTIDPDSFKQSDKDRLSGGLTQKVPFRMATDSRGRILITDPFLSVIQVLDIEGDRRSQMSGESIRRMVFPTYIAVDATDNIYVSEPTLAAVLAFRPDGRFLRAISSSQLHLPFGLALDKVNNRLYVVDHERSEIQEYSLEGQFLKTISSRGTAVGELISPTDIALSNGMLYVLDAGNSRFQSFDLEGHPRAILPFGNNWLPIAFSIDTSGNLYCVDQISLGLLVLDSSGNRITAYATRRPYGQPGPASPFPVYTALVGRPDGSMFALGPNLTIDILKLEPTKPTSKNVSEP